MRCLSLEAVSNASNNTSFCLILSFTRHASFFEDLEEQSENGPSCRKPRGRRSKFRLWYHLLSEQYGSIVHGTMLLNSHNIFFIINYMASRKEFYFFENNTRFFHQKLTFRHLINGALKLRGHVLKVS